MLRRSPFGPGLARTSLDPMQSQQDVERQSDIPVAKRDVVTIFEAKVPLALVKIGLLLVIHLEIAPRVCGHGLRAAAVVEVIHLEPRTNVVHFAPIGCVLDALRDELKRGPPLLESRAQT